MALIHCSIPHAPPEPVNSGSGGQIIPFPSEAGRLPGEELCRIVEKYDIARLLPDRRDPRGGRIKDPNRVIAGAFYPSLVGIPDQRLPRKCFGPDRRYAIHRLRWMKDEDMWGVITHALLDAIKREGYPIDPGREAALLQGRAARCRVSKCRKRRTEEERYPSDLLWEEFIRIEPYVRAAIERKLGPESTRGRPRVQDLYRTTNGIIYKYHTNCGWDYVPRVYGKPSTLRKYARILAGSGIFREIKLELLKELHEQGKLDLSTVFLDGSHVDAQEGAEGTGRGYKGHGWRIMLICDGNKLPIAVFVCNSQRSEQETFEPVLKEIPEELRAEIAHLVADKGFDSTKCRDMVREQGMTPLIPVRKNRVNDLPSHEEMEKTREASRSRHLVENTFADMKQWASLRSSRERSQESFQGVVDMKVIQLYLRFQRRSSKRSPVATVS